MKSQANDVAACNEASIETFSTRNGSSELASQSNLGNYQTMWLHRGYRVVAI